ncbi:DUF7281 domain-containing protein [Rhodoferax fermentans]|uniref:DUF7281 domain-containing protein n=1 Tax=Rhodoferax fermentans TaxID=28066 RepID=A0A1T1AMH0_RHOFE|nr:hypothetical protein [Rhodoferax fermentans]MBK1683921.1 hypothetical protein [Rhodoferax fermentans]OOV05351.1 hypothetical protein RF819_00275 [Rhodoferax fermentans]
MNLTPIELRFLQRLLADRRDRPHSASAERFYVDRKIGTPIGRKFVYSQEDVERVRSLLEALRLPLAASDQLIDRADAVLRPGISEKSGTVNPHANTVAFKVFAGGSPTTRPGYQVASVEEVAGLTPDLVMVVENFETLRQLERYQWVIDRLTSVKTALTIFKGDNIYRLDDAQNCISLFDCPVWGFHDFDPAGLHMSLSIRNIEEHLVPPQGLLAAAVVAQKRSDLYFNQYNQYAGALDLCDHPQIAALWSLMKRWQKGLPQEWMRDLSLTTTNTSQDSSTT